LKYLFTHKSKTNTMKKLLLSSIIMFGVCGFVTAQNATDSRLKKAATPTNSISPAPQKAAVPTGTDVTPASDNPDGTKQVELKKVEGVKIAPPTSADVAGVPVTESDMAKKKEMQKAADAKATAVPVKKSKQQN
jgi:hypothetical protein